MLKAYKYRLYPNEEQQAKLTQWFGMCRFVYNIGLEVKIRAWKDAQRSVSSYELMRQLNELKRTESPWLAECSSQSLESSLTNLGKAFQGFYNKKSGFPRFKKRSSRQSIIFRRDTSVSGSKIRLTKLGWMPFLEHRPLGKGEIRTLTVSKNSSGHFFVSILIKCEKGMPPKRPVTPESSAGVDMGLTAFATLSDGQIIGNPKYLYRQLQRLRIEQRTLGRRYKKGKKTSDQSKGWQNQKLIVAKLYEKVANQREDFLHKTSTAIVKQFDTICLESLNITGMMKNTNLSKAISDVSWGRFNTMLQYKAEWYGKNICYIGMFEPSSKMCGDCGSVVKELKLSDRVWTCESCGSVHDRDLNAAINIKNFGLRKQPSSANVSH